MLDWIWEGLAILAGIAAFWFGFKAKRIEKKVARDEAERKEAAAQMIERSHRALEETRRQHAGKAPISTSKRTDFE